MKTLKELPDIVELHRGVDEETGGKKHRWECIKDIKALAKTKNKKVLVAVAGGIEPTNMQDALKHGADIIVVGRYITQSKDISKRLRKWA